MILISIYEVACPCVYVYLSVCVSVNNASAQPIKLNSGVRIRGLKGPSNSKNMIAKTTTKLDSNCMLLYYNL